MTDYLANAQQKVLRQWGLTIVSSAVVRNSANIRRTEFYQHFFLTST
jgi:hypothetical protein